MNVAVLNLKTLSRNILKIIVLICASSFFILIIHRFINVICPNISFELCSSIYSSFFYTNEILNIDETSLLQMFAPTIVASNNDKELLQINSEKVEEKKKEEITNTNNNNNNLNIETIIERNIPESYNLTYSNVKVRNQSDYEITNDILAFEDLNILENKKVLIYHTHTCESYTTSEKYNYSMTGNYRTTDNNYNVVRVGDELTNALKEKGFEVIHNTNYHDYPSYNGSYERSLQTVQSILEQNKDIQIVIDLHRDAVGDGSSYGPTVKINGQSVAQMMLVVGTDGGGLEHPNWRQNLKAAVKLQSKANEMYPGLFRPIIVRNSRYNQHVAPGAWIIEVGATGNTLDECILSMQFLANVIEESFK